MDKNIKICLVCEKEIPLWSEDGPDNCIEGGTIKVHFGFGSRYDWIGLMKPKYGPTDPILKDKKGYHPTDIGKILGEEKSGTIVYIPDASAEVEMVPHDNIPQDREDLKIASHGDNIKAHICDDCFEKKIKFFRR